MGENMGNIGGRVSALLTVGVLLSGCNAFSLGPGPEAEGSPAQPVASTEPTRPVSAPAEPGSPASTAPAEGATPQASAVLPLADLEARVSRLVDAQGQPFALVPQEQLAAGMDDVRDGLDGAVIEPAECAEAAKTSLRQMPEGAAAASGVSASDPLGSTTVVSVVSSDDPKAPAAGLGFDPNRCAEFAFEVGGQRVTATMEELPIDPVGGETVSFLLTQSLPTGQTMYFMTVTAMQGTTVASAQQVGTAEPDLVTQDELGRLAGELLTGKPAAG